MFIERPRSAPAPVETRAVMRRSALTESAVKNEQSIHHIIMQNIHDI